MSFKKAGDTVTILLVDDSDTDRTLAAGLMGMEPPDWTILPEPSAAAGLNVLSRRPVNVVVTDLVMPGMTGTEFLQEVRHRFPAIPVILITSQGDDRIAAQSLELGAVNYVPKRLLADNLVPAVDEILRSQREAAVSGSVLEHLMSSRMAIRIDNDLEEVRSLVHVVRERLQALHRLSDDEVRQVTDAVREALMNAYFHGNLESNSVPLEHSREDYMRISELRRTDSEYGGRTIELELTHISDHVCFSIADSGKGFDTGIVTDLTGAPSDDFPNGNGFRIIQRYMDCIEFNDAGSRISLTKNLTAERND